MDSNGSGDDSNTAIDELTRWKTMLVWQLLVRMLRLKMLRLKKGACGIGSKLKMVRPQAQNAISVALRSLVDPKRVPDANLKKIEIKNRQNVSNDFEIKNHQKC